MHYYEIAVTGAALPPLTYHAQEAYEPGDVVSVLLRGKEVNATVLRLCNAPDFKTKAIPPQEVTHHYPDTALKSAKFICQYYRCHIGEALGLFIPFAKRNDTLTAPPPTPIALPKLTSAQQKAFEALQKHERALLFGVTGSGKTEIFIAQMARTLQEGKGVIMLMPEIALTLQMEKRLKRYFGDAIAIWHSKIGKKKKESILKGIEEGRIRIVAGARSALFVSMPDLGLIVIDEEHDDSYKAQSRPRYHARDTALYLAKVSGAKALLASATPTASSYHRFATIKLQEPYVKTQRRYRFIEGCEVDSTVIEALRENFHKGGKSLVFVPTRANFKYLYCTVCGKTHTCPFCSVAMSLHRKKRLLRCHYCNYTEAIREVCAHCGGGPLLSERMGTQEAIEKIRSEIEGIRIEQFDSDAVTTVKKLNDALRRFEEGESHVLLGTQMLSKGHDYPDITLSVITGIDYVAGGADYRAREKGVAMAVQIAGRSGRAKDAQVLIQTANSEAFAPYMQDYERFIQEELAFRKNALYPPFATLARVLVTHKNDAKAYAVCESLVEKMRRFRQVDIVGWGKAPVERIAGKWRYHILLKSQKRTDMIKVLQEVDAKEAEVDMDPVDFS